MKLKTKTAKKLAVKLRHEALTSNDQHFLRRAYEILKRVLDQTALLLELESSRQLQSTSYMDSICHNYVYISRVLSLVHKRLSILDTDRSLWNRRLNRTIDSFTDEQIKNNFNFQNRGQLHALYSCLGIPNRIRLDNGCRVYGEEALLVTIYRLSWPRKLTQIEETFGRDYSLWSRCIKFMIDFIVDNWCYLLFDNMDYWLLTMPHMHSAIVDKLVILGYNFDTRLLGVDLETQHNIFGFIDNTIAPICRPAGGPADDGVNARRLDPLIQRAFYTGWKKLHGLKLQTIDLPNEMTFHAYGPNSSLRREMIKDYQ